MSKVRVRFAPSPTGGLHIGGVRTVLFNYLFAKKKQGSFIVRIEDTDQTRFVAGAEAYIFECLQWCGLQPDESTIHPGEFGPYRQSERKEMYRQYAEQLVRDGYAYYAFDTPDEIEAMRQQLKAAGSESLQYDHRVRLNMNNSLRLLPHETAALLAKGTPYVVRIKIDPAESVTFKDMIRGDITFNTDNVDDKVLLKADGMPTYHLAVVVDDFLMKITHAFRGEEWMPSTPVHILLWKYLFGLSNMPQWAHLPLILKPDGNGKLSKRDGDRLGFPVFAMDWKDPATNELIKGFKEIGFLPEALINFLALQGWNDGTEQEIFSISELIEKFSIERVHTTGAKFDFEKAKWFNHEWIKKSNDEYLVNKLIDAQPKLYDTIQKPYLIRIMGLIKDRCNLLTDFWEQGHFFFEAPSAWDTVSIQQKWDESKKEYFHLLASRYDAANNFSKENTESVFKTLATEKNIKTGELQMILRIMLVGTKKGPGIFAIAETIGKEETIKRIQTATAVFD